MEIEPLAVPLGPGALALLPRLATALDGGRDVGQRDDRAHLLPLARELERRHVALDAVVVRRQGGRAHQLDGAVLTHQAGAGLGGARAHHPRDGHAAHRREQLRPHRRYVHRIPPRPLARTVGRAGCGCGSPWARAVVRERAGR